MMYRLGFPLLMVTVLACIGIASATDVLPDAVLDFLSGSDQYKARTELANLAKGQPARQEEGRSSAGSNGGAALPADLFKDFFDMAQAGFPTDISASLVSQGAPGDGPRNYGFASGFGSSGNVSRGYSVLSGPAHNQGGNGSGGSGGSGVAGAGSAGGSGGGSGATGGGPAPSMVLASLMTGSDDMVPGDSKNIPTVGGDVGVLPPSPQLPYIPEVSFGPKDDPLLGAPIQDVLPDANSGGQNPDPAPIPNPEPGTLILGGMGLAALIVARRRMKSRQGE